MIIRIPIHSITDLITNSSTVIYTYSDGSLDACRKMVDAILKTVGCDKTCDDIFKLRVEPNRDELADSVYDQVNMIVGDGKKLRGIPSKWVQLSCDEKKKAVSNVLDMAKRPRWLKEFIAGITGKETFLSIEAKDPKFEVVAEAIVDFLYSTNHEESDD